MTKKNVLLDKLIKATTLEDVAILSEQDIHRHDPISTPVPMINVALSANPAGGVQPGSLMIAGDSKHFKTGFGLLLVSAFLARYEDAVVLFYDSEFGHNDSYFDLFGIEKSRIIHCPITTVEEWRTDIKNQLNTIERGDHVMILVDSIGMLASAKEVADAEAGNEKADMTRARTLNSAFRIIGPHLTLKGIPMVVINHTYKEIGTMYPQEIISGGKKAYLNANDIWIIGRSKDMDDKELVGYNFTIRVEKSRTVKEGSRIPITISFEKGINKYSGLFEFALEQGIIDSPSKGRYRYTGNCSEIVAKDKTFTRSAMDVPEFWDVLLKDPEFLTQIKDRYALA